MPSEQTRLPSREKRPATSTASGEFCSRISSHRTCRPRTNRPCHSMCFVNCNSDISLPNSLLSLLIRHHPCSRCFSSFLHGSIKGSRLRVIAADHSNSVHDTDCHSCKSARIRVVAVPCNSLCLASHQTLTVTCTPLNTILIAGIVLPDLVACTATALTNFRFRDKERSLLIRQTQSHRLLLVFTPLSSRIDISVSYLDIFHHMIQYSPHNASVGLPCSSYSYF